MRSWEEIIAEAKSKKEKELEDRVSQLGDIPDSLKTSKSKKKQKDNKSSSYTKYLEKQLKYKKQKYEEQKKRQLEKVKEKEEREKERAGKTHLAKAARSLSGINIRKVGKDDSAVTGIKKSVETAGSMAKGLGGAAFHGIAALVKKRKAKKEAEKKSQEAQFSQPEKKEPGKPGRPKSEKKDVKAVNVKNVTSDDRRKISGGPERKKLVPSTKRLPPASKKLPPSGGAPYQTPPAPDKSTGMTLGQRARRNPELKKRLISQRNEMYSDWKTEFLLESGLILEVDTNGNDKKKKVIDVMRGKNKIEINPNISEDHKEIASGKKKDDEGYMANVELDQMERAIKALRKKVKRSDTQLPAWVQSKITRAADYIDTASEYLQSDDELSEEDCSCKDGSSVVLKALENKKKKKNYQLISGIIGEDNLNEMAPLAAIAARLAPSVAGRAASARAAGGRVAMSDIIKDKAKEIAVDKVKEKMQQKLSGNTNQTGSGENPIETSVRGLQGLFKVAESAWSQSIDEAIDKDKMKCNKPKAQAVGDSLTGKSHVVKACEGGKEKIIRFGQKGVKGSPKKKGESEAYASRRRRFQSRHEKNIAKGKMSAAYWANKVKW